MKTALILLVVVLAGAACSSPAGEVNSSGQNPGPNGDQLTASNSQLVPLENVNADAFNAAPPNIPVVNRDSKDMEPVVGPKPAPDESEVNTVQQKDGSFKETRTFKNHPQLLKVERITAGRDVKMKVYLKNGKVIPVESAKLPQFNVIAPGNILAAAGVKPVNPNAGENKNKKASEEGETDNK